MTLTVLNVLKEDRMKSVQCEICW